MHASSRSQMQTQRFRHMPWLIQILHVFIGLKTLECCFLIVACAYFLKSALSNMAETIVEDVTSRISLLNAQRGTAGFDASKTQEGQARAILLKLETLGSIQAPSATAITQAIKAYPHWTQPQLAGMLAKIGELASHNQIGADDNRNNRCQQSCDSISHIFTERDWAQLEDLSVPFPDCQRIVSTRMYKLGIVCPKEKLLKQAASVLHLVRFKNSDVDEVGLQRCAKKIKELIKEMDDNKKYPLAHVRSYPANITTLPQQMLAFCYGDEMPVRREFPLLDSISNTFNYRGVQRVPTLNLNRASSSASLQGGFGMGMAPMMPPMMLMQMFQQMQHQYMNQRPQDEYYVDPMRYRSMPQQRSQRAICDGDPTTADGNGSLKRSPSLSPSPSPPRSDEQGMTEPPVKPPAEPSAEPPVDTLDDFESRMQALVDTRKANKGSSAASKRAANTRKRPAAATDLNKGRPAAATDVAAAEQPKKKPAANNKIPDDVHYRDLVDPSTTGCNNRGSFTSGAYHTTRNRAIKQGYSEDRAKEFGKIAHRIAADAYDNQ